MQVPNNTQAMLGFFIPKIWRHSSRSIQHIGHQQIVRNHDLSILKKNSLGLKVENRLFARFSIHKRHYNIRSNHKKIKLERTHPKQTLKIMGTKRNDF